MNINLMEHVMHESKAEFLAKAELPTQFNWQWSTVLNGSPLQHRMLEWLITPVIWYSFCQPQKDDLSQPSWCYFNGATAAQLKTQRF